MWPPLTCAELPSPPAWPPRPAERVPSRVSPPHPGPVERLGRARGTTWSPGEDNHSATFPTEILTPAEAQSLEPKAQPAKSQWPLQECPEDTERQSGEMVPGNPLWGTGAGTGSLQGTSSAPGVWIPYLRSKLPCPLASWRLGCRHPGVVVGVARRGVSKRSRGQRRRSPARTTALLHQGQRLGDVSGGPLGPVPGSPVQRAHRRRCS